MGTSKNYVYTVEWSEEDGEYLATCSTIGGQTLSVSCLHDTPIQALAGLVDLIESDVSFYQLAQN